MSTLLVICICGAAWAPSASTTYRSDSNAGPTTVTQKIELGKESVMTELNDDVAVRFTVLGPESFTRQNVLVVIGPDVEREGASYLASALHGTVVDNGDGTFTYAPPAGSQAQADLVSIVTGDTVIEVEMHGPDVALDFDAAVSGPFGIDDHPMLGLHRREHLFFYRVPADFIHVGSAEIHGARNGNVGRFEWFEVHQDPKTTVFGELDHGDRMGREFGLAAGTYLGFVYEPDDEPNGPSTDTLFFTVHDATGSIWHSSSFAIDVPAVSISAAVRWSPRSGPNASAGSIDVTRLDAFTGSTYLPTGEVVFEVSTSDEVNDDVMVTFTQPAHGTLIALPGGSWGDPGGEAVRLVYTPDPRYRTDPTVYTDDFTFEVDDGRGGLSVTTVPVLIAKKALVDANDGRPYLGNESFTGRVDPPFDGVQGYLAVATALLSESVGSLIDNPGSVGSTLFGAVTIDGEGRFTYTRDPEWADLPVDQFDDSFAVIAYTADNQWAAAVVPVGGKALSSYPPIIDILEGLPRLPGSVGS